MNTIEEIDKQIAELTKTKEYLIKSNDIRSLKTGDYVVCLDIKINFNGKMHPLTVGKTYKIETVDDYGIRVINDNGVAPTIDDGGYYLRRFRPATEAEVNIYLIEEATKQGFVIGAKIIFNDVETPINSIVIYRPEYKHIGIGKGHFWSCSVTSFYDKVKKPFVVIGFLKILEKPMAELILAPKEPPITVTVDGQKYIAKFCDDYVEFGCATISNELFTNCNDFLKSGDIEKGNRCVTGVQIGKGLFTNELIYQIVERIKAKKS